MQNEWAKMANALDDVLDNGGGGASVTATATANWHRGGGTPYVMTNIGQVFFPKHPAKDPNVINGQEINIRPRAGGGWLAVECLDSKIGMSMGWCLSSGDIPQGWAIQDGVANSSGNGGTGINKIGSYTKWGTTAGVSGGTDSYTPTGTVAEHTMTGNLFGDLSYGGTASTYSYNYSGTTTVYYDLDLSALQSDEFTIAEHDAHNHDTNPFVSFNGVELGSTELFYFYQDNVLGTGATEHQPQRAYFTESSSFSTSADFDLSAWDHAHDVDMSQWDTTITVPYELIHDHNWTGDEMIIDPPNVTEVPIERLGNFSG
jgi:hypothetical protein